MSDYRWALSPSKLATSKNSCPCFKESESWGAEYKNAGTNLHEYSADRAKPLDDLSPDAQALVQFCRDFEDATRAAVDIQFEKHEFKIPATNRHPSGTADWVFVTRDGACYVIDWKYGQQPVPAENNEQLRCYALMVYLEYGRLRGDLPALPEIKSITVGIVQPALGSSELVELPMSELPAIESEIREINDRVVNPVKLPDASNPDVCRRCEYLHQCPAVTKGVALATHAFGLPMPENFDPGSLVSDRDRIIAQDLGAILSAWADQVKERNKEYAIQNGGTIGGVYNITTRSNGTEIQDMRGLADALVEEGVLENPDQILDFVALRKTALIEGLSGPDRDVAPIVKKLEERLGVPRPPVSVFRRGGKKQVKAAEELLDIPMLENPFKKKHSDE